MTIVNVLLPLLSVLLGAAITYWINVRTRRRTRVEDLFDRAIAAVAVADASVNYISSFAEPNNLSAERFVDLEEEFVVVGIRNWNDKIREATDALAQVLPYQPEIASEIPYRTQVDIQRAPQVIELLKRGRREALRRQKRRLETKSS